MHVLDVNDLQRLCASPWGLEDYSPLGEHKCLLLDLAGPAAAFDAGTHPALVERLRGLPCPVLALAEPGDARWLAGVDVVLEADQEAAPLVQNIRRNPLAATTLVQLLRLAEGLDVRRALLAESLAYASLQAGAEFHPAAPASDPGQPADVAAGEAPVLLAREGGELHITLNRPGTRNAYSSAMRDSLYEALQLLRADDSLERAVVRGAGSCFCIGGDLGEFGSVSDPATAHAIRCSRNVPLLLAELAPRLEFHLHRACIGSGIELPAFAGRVIARRDTFIQLPEITMGLLPGAGGTVSITARIGRHRTAWLVLSARRIRAATALEWGLVDELE